MSCHGDFLGISRRTSSLLKVKNKTHENLETYCNPTNSTNHCQAAHHEAWHMGHGSQWCNLTLRIGKPWEFKMSAYTIGPWCILHNGTYRTWKLMDKSENCIINCRAQINLNRIEPSQSPTTLEVSVSLCFQTWWATRETVLGHLQSLARNCQFGSIHDGEYWQI